LNERTNLVVDELDFDRLHGRDREDGFRNSGAEAAKQPDAKILFLLKLKISNIVISEVDKPFELF
jgi:hypothetical protein